MVDEENFPYEELQGRSLITERFSPEYTIYQKFPMSKHTSLNL